MKQVLLNGESQGFSSLEVLIAGMILALAVVAISSVVFGSQSAIVSGGLSAEAAIHAESILQAARVLGEENFEAVLSKSAELKGSYMESVEVVTMGLYAKSVSAVVQWEGEDQRKEVKLSTVITNRHGLMGGDTCSWVMDGDWARPQVITYDLGQELIGNSAGIFPITDIDAHEGYIYVTVSNAHANTNPNLFVFHQNSSPDPPSLVSAVDTAPSVSEGLNSIIVAGKYAFIASAYGANFATCHEGPACSQLQIFDIESAPPKNVRNFKLPGILGKSGQSVGKYVVYKDGYVYLGLAKTAGGPEFNIIDVTDPSNPIYKGGYIVGSGINSIAIRGEYAYLATPNSEELIVIDIRDPSNPRRVGGFDAPGGSGNGKSLALMDKYIFLGRTVGGTELYILKSEEEPGVLEQVGTWDLGSSSANGIILKNYLAFILAGTQLLTFKIDDPASITPYAPSLNLPGTGSSIDCEGGVIYAGSVSSAEKGYLSVITAGQ